jgi:hypothetical protein
MLHVNNISKVLLTRSEIMLETQVDLVLHFVASVETHLQKKYLIN